MINNRFSRILYPFLAFMIILTPLVSFGFTYTGLTFSGSEDAFSKAFSSLADPMTYIPLKTYHLWFLYYLLLVTLLSFGIGILLKKLPGISRKITGVFDPIIQYPFLKLIVFSSLTFVVLFLMDRTWVATNFSMIPNPKTLGFYSFFYLFGWILYKSKQPLGQLKQFDWLFTILGIILFSIKFNYSSSFGKEAAMAINALLVWLFTFGFTGLFIRYGSKHSALMRYVSDASYWFYLIHLPITLILPGLIMNWQLHAVFKFMIVLSFTLALCAVTYHYFVRSTFIGKFLNGRKYPRSISIEQTPGKLQKAA